MIESETPSTAPATQMAHVDKTQTPEQLTAVRLAGANQADSRALGSQVQDAAKVWSLSRLQQICSCPQVKEPQRLPCAEGPQPEVLSQPTKASLGHSSSECRNAVEP